VKEERGEPAAPLLLIDIHARQKKRTSLLGTGPVRKAKSTLVFFFSVMAIFMLRVLPTVVGLRFLGISIYFFAQG
jgi:hypothetical protein